MYTIMALVDVEPQIRDEFLALTLESARGAHGERGCHRFDIVQPPDDPNRLGAYEVYRDRAAFEAHRAQPYFQTWFDAYQQWQRDGLVRASIVSGTHVLSADPAYG
jgi:quinol monooxygenase YgiN